LAEGCFLSDKPREYAFAGRLEEASRLEAQAKAVEKIIEGELEILGLKPNMRVLDAECGTGAITRRIASKVFPAEAFGIDIDPLFIDKAKKAALDEGIKNVHFELGDIDNLRYDGGFFDLAYCNVVLMHVKNPVKTISELKRVTRRGGVVAASDVDDDTLLIYPPAPKFLELWSEWAKRAKARGMDRHVGRKLYSIFSEAGLSFTRIYPLPMVATQQDPDALGALVYQYVKILEQDKNAMLTEGVTTERDFEEALKEVRHFLENPGSFIMVSFFLAVGECSG
jgi:ubiquinone/menaquinone biosynthesis C-methylase UbiE